MPKNILVFADGTGNEGGLLPDESRTNVYKLYRATRTGPDSIVDPSKQIAFYIHGIGTPSAGHTSKLSQLSEALDQMVGGGLPSEWLPQIWGGDAPEFADEDEAKAILAIIMARYNEILRQIDDDTLDPVFWVDRDGMLIAADWAEGFLQAVMLRMDAWDRLLKSKRDGQLLFPIFALCGDENGESLLGIAPEDEDRVMEEVTEFIPACVAAIAAYWRGQGPKQISMPLMPSPPPPPIRASTKVGQNEPCPCGSGKKFKKCCGKNG